MKKTGLKTLAVILSITSLLSISPIKTGAVSKNDLRMTMIGVGAGAALVTTAAAFGILAGNLLVLLKKDVIKRHWKNELFKDHIESNKLTKRSKGYNWQWLACLQGLLKNRGIEKSQKSMYKGITGKSPNRFECFRRNGLAFFEDSYEAKKLKSNYKGTGLLGDGTEGSCAYLGQVRNYIEKVSNNKYTYKVEYIDADVGKISDVCNKIKEIYIKNGKSPFSIMDSTGYVVHTTVNIIEIDENDNIIVEDPYLELRRTEPLENFVARYRNFRISEIGGNAKLTQTFKKHKIPGIPVTYIAPKNNA